VTASRGESREGKPLWEGRRGDAPIIRAVRELPARARTKRSTRKTSGDTKFGNRSPQRRAQSAALPYSAERINSSCGPSGSKSDVSDVTPCPDFRNAHFISLVRSRISTVPGSYSQSFQNAMALWIGSSTPETSVPTEDNGAGLTTLRVVLDAPPHYGAGARAIMCCTRRAGCMETCLSVLDGGSRK
jgi:hypothetical protein